MKTAGVVIDFYDDPSAGLLRQVFPTVETLPEIVKQAHILSSEERDVLRNEAFALVLVNEGVPMKKFACVDAGNTALSAMYFIENHGRLPEEAVKVACANLIAACEAYNLPTEELEKIARVSMGRKRDPMAQTGYVGDEADWAQRTNLLSVRGGSDSGRVIPTANSMKTAGVDGGGMVLTDDKRNIGTSSKAPATQTAKPQLTPTPHPAEQLRGANNTIVDVTGKEPKLKLEKKASQRTALNGSYALDSYADVKKAVEYFGDCWTVMDPDDRHEFAVKTASRAGELGIDVPDLMARYGSTEYAPDIEAHLSNRRALRPDWNEVWDEIKEKRAEIDPERFAQLLAEADKAAGLHVYWGGEVADPWLATFGGGIEKDAGVWSWQGRTGDYVTEERLKNLSINGRPLIHKHFSSEITNAFCKDPIAIFESLPDTHKSIISRLANETNLDGLAAN
jgi:hypothetical protein